MIPFKRFFAGLAAFALVVVSAQASVILDDTFADGARNNQNLPTDAAWYVSGNASWKTSAGALTVTNGTGAILGVTYFGANSSTPVSLAVGDTLTVAVSFTFNNVAAQNSSQGFRFGVYDFADSTLSPKWATADLGSNSGQGAGVKGYTLLQNFGLTFNNGNPINLGIRTNVTSTSLLGTASDHKVLVSGPGSVTALPGFTNGGQYVLRFVLFRTNATDLLATASWQNLSGGATISVSVLDTNAATFNFDGIGMRPSSAVTTATNITINEVRVDLVSAGAPPEMVNSPLDQTVYTNQPASFSATAAGTAPLAYQWYFNDTATPLLNATNNTFALASAQLADAGNYFVIVTNSLGSVTSDVATLTVTIPAAPSIAIQPQSQTVLPGQSVTFNVSAGGAAPLFYQWYFNTNTALAGAADAAYSFTNAQPGNDGTYSVVITNFMGTVTSSFAVLSVDTSPVAPVFVTQPASQTALLGASVTFNPVVSGTAPIYFQWQKNGVIIPGATNASFTLSNVQLTNMGNYALTATNNVGGAISGTATLTVTPTVALPDSAFNLVGFAQLTTGGGVIPETDPAYRKVTNALDLANAILASYKTAGSVKVIEIMNDLDLGWNEIGAAVQTLSSTPFRAHATPQLHPRLLVTGVSLIDIKPKSGLTIFSANGATIRHACFNVKSTANIIIRNLKFDEMWEWDEASKGNYDKNDWDFIDLGNGGTVTNIWIDHCTFTKAYDGEVDIKQGSSGITFSWCKYVGDDGATNTNSWVRQQISSLESNKTSYAFYNFLRNNGFSTEDIVTILQGHDKTHLIGANSLKAENANHTVTFHHDWFMNPWDRLPRLRGGNVHNFNIYVDDTLGLAAKRLRDARADAMNTANRNTLNNTYNFNPFLNGSISTESGAVLVEKSVYVDCLTPLRNNQTDVTDPEYTGKIQALDTVYQMDNTDGSTTIVRGNSTDPGNPLGPFQAAIIPFSWNLPGNQLPYAYTPDDPSQLHDMLEAGAGAGVLTWNKTNWLKTAYASTAPTIVVQPQSQSVDAGNPVTFSVVAGGSAPFAYQWYFNTNTFIPDATNAVFTTTNAGVYSVVVTNNAGSITSAFAALSLNNPSAGFSAWQQANFTPEQLADQNISGPDAAPTGDGVKNFVKYALGLSPLTPTTNALTSLVFTNGAWALSYQRPAGITDVIYLPEASTNLAGWDTNGFSNELLGTDPNGMQTWRAAYGGATNALLFYQLLLKNQN